NQNKIVWCLLKRSVTAAPQGSIHDLEHGAARALRPCRALNVNEQTVSSCIRPVVPACGKFYKCIIQTRPKAIPKIARKNRRRCRGDWGRRIAAVVSRQPLPQDDVQAILTVLDNKLKALATICPPTEEAVTIRAATTAAMRIPYSTLATPVSSRKRQVNNSCIRRSSTFFK